MFFTPSTSRCATLFAKLPFVRAARDESGATAAIFGMTFAVLVAATGSAIDYSRASSVASLLGATLDSAALAAAKELSNGANSSDVEKKARAYVTAHLNANNLQGAKLRDVKVSQDHSSNTLTVSAGADVETIFMKLAGIDTVAVGKTAVAAFKSKDIELSMVLDVTGSMGGSKIRDLQKAARNAVETLLSSADATSAKVRIGLVPYAASVNAGDYAHAASGGQSRDNCVVERSGTHAYDSTAPAAGSFVNAYPNEATKRNSHYSCPASQVIPLTDDQDRLTRTIDKFRTGGWTAGHVGAAWGWYQIAPEWKSVWPSASRPSNYGTENLVKAVVLMTDGEFNTSYANGNVNRTSSSQARNLCAAMKKKGVLIYAVGFKLEEKSAQALMKQCASINTETGNPHLYLADNGQELDAAFKAVTENLLKLRLAK